MKILRTIGILAIVAGLVIGGTGNVFAKGPPDPLPGSGNHSSSKHGLFGTVSSVATGEAVVRYTITLDTQQGNVDVTINEDTKYKIPRQTHGPKANLTTFVEIVDENGDTDLEELEGRRIAALVQFTNESTADALRLMLIPITPPLHAHPVGIVTDFTPYTPDENGNGGSVIIRDNHGVSHIFGINGETVYRPDETEDTDIELGSFVTVVTTGDPKNPDNDVAKAIVLHEELPDWAPGKIIVDKVTDPTDSLVDFEFSPSWTSNFFLADATTPEDSGWLLPGSYSVSEIVPPGWTLLSAVTDDDDGSDPGSITLDPGETVTVTFTNEQLAKITVYKQTTPDGESQLFDFTEDWGGSGSFQLVDDGSTGSGWIAVGTYNVYETPVPDGWDLDSIGVSGVTTYTTNTATGLAQVTLDYGDHAEITYTNELLD